MGCFSLLMRGHYLTKSSVPDLTNSTDGNLEAATAAVAQSQDSATECYHSAIYAV
jgi:hypothetical protein